MLKFYNTYVTKSPKWMKMMFSRDLSLRKGNWCHERARMRRSRKTKQPANVLSRSILVLLTLCIEIINCLIHLPCMYFLNHTVYFDVEIWLL